MRPAQIEGGDGGPIVLSGAIPGTPVPEFDASNQKFVVSGCVILAQLLDVVSAIVRIRLVNRVGVYDQERCERDNGISAEPSARNGRCRSLVANDVTCCERRRPC